MRATKVRFRFCSESAVIILAVICMIFAPALVQNSAGQENAQVKTGKVPIVGGFEQIRALPAGGPTPRMADGRPDLTGRWYPNAAGKMLQVAYPVDKRRDRH
jgi:hypothetical protein